MNNRTNIYFIGRKQGVGFRHFRMSHLENRRKYESEGLKDAKESIVQTRWITKADVIWVRVRPEHTNDKERVAVEKHLLHLRDKIPIINDIAIFDHYDCKDQSFQLWKKHGILCPDFITINENSISENSEENILLISNFIEKHGKIFLRTNNETASLGMHTLTSESGRGDIEHALLLLKDRVENQKTTRSSTKILGTEFIHSNKDSEYQDLYRVHTLFGNILSFYAVTSKKEIFHNVDMDERDMNRFIDLNEDLCNKIDSLKEIVLNAVKALNCNLGAIEFFLVNEKPIFIELNPMWGGHASIHGFGNEKMRTYLIENRKVLEKRIPNIYNFMDRRAYYKKLYEFIHKHISSLKD